MKRKDKQKDRKSAPIGLTEPPPALTFKPNNGEAMPSDSYCIYCGEPKGVIWIVDGVPICGHCGYKYTRKGVDVW